MKKKNVFIISLISLVLSSCSFFSNVESNQTKEKDKESSLVATSSNGSSESKSASKSSSVGTSQQSSSSQHSSSSYQASSTSSGGYSSSSYNSASSSSSYSSSSDYSSSSSSFSSSSSNTSTPQQDTIVNLELFALNDVHGNVEDSTTGLGIGKTTTLLKTYPDNVNNALYISQGDMWQGSAPSNLTKGQLVNDWMNQMNFTSMTVGNHEFDWSTSYVRTNAGLANFPYLGINVYSRDTNQRVDYLDPSVIINKNGAKIGIIGAIGDCYSSISASMVQDIYFKVGNDLTNLVKQEATRLKNEEGCDMVIYSIHDGSGSTSSLDYEYDTSLSNGYVDLVLEGHTHKNYILTDSYGVYHIQSAGYNKTISYINVNVNTTKNTCSIVKTKSIYTNDYVDKLSDDETAMSLFTKYADQISGANEVLGHNSSYRSSSEIKQLVADLYLQYGLSKWSSSYNIYLGGGYVSTRSPYNLEAGDVTYADLVELLPFNNHLVLCSISGYNLNYKFVNTSNSNYYISLSSYGQANSYINYNDTYYVVVDTYTSDYASNGLTVIERYTEDEFYARDMIAEYIRNGGMA